DGAGGGEHGRLAVAHAVGGGDLVGLVPALLGGGQQVGRDQLLVDLGGGLLVLAQHPEHVLLVLLVAGERAHPGGGAGRGGVGVAGHERRDGGGVGPTGVAVVGKAEGHQHGAEVGV